MARSDEELIQAIAKNRDQSAFEELYLRHRNACYCLAMRLTANPPLAADAVQECMLRVWRYANSYTPRGSARSWILKILARETINMKRSQKRNSHRDANATRQELSFSTDTTTQTECAAALRKLIDRLPDLDMKLIGLYYAGNLNQTEIAKAMNMPQTTISRRIKKTLEVLRTNLAKAGFTATIPMLESHGIIDALLGGFQSPADLCIEALEIFKQPSMDLTRSNAFAKLNWKLWIPLSVFTVTAVAILLNNTVKRKPNATSATEDLALVEPPHASVKHSLEASPSTSLPKPETNKVPFHKIWEFKKEGFPQDFTVIHGDWQWSNANNTKTGALIVRNEISYLLLPAIPHTSAFMISVFYKGIKPGHFTIGVGLSDGRKILNKLRWFSPEIVTITGKTILHKKIYFSGSRVLARIVGRNSEYHEFQNPATAHTANRVFVDGHNVRVTRIEWQELNPEELPKDLLDATPLWKKLGVAPVFVPGGLISHPIPIKTLPTP